MRGACISLKHLRPQLATTVLTPLTKAISTAARSLFEPERRSQTIRAVSSGPPAPESMMTISGSNEQTSTTAPEPLVMQIIVRRDLFDKEKWGVGPLMAQAAHAATAVLHETRERRETIDYLADLKHMRKVALQTPDVSALEKLSAALSRTDPPIPHHLWTEQPENVPTCIAIAPNRKEKPIRKALDKSSCRLWRTD